MIGKYFQVFINGNYQFTQWGTSRRDLFFWYSKQKMPKEDLDRLSLKELF